MNKTLMAFFALVFLIGCSHFIKKGSQDNITVLSISDVNWEQLNPARKDKSPKAATLWGDRKGNSATGFLVKFVDGFSSPPHIHNVSYKGIVIEGLIHNDDPKATDMWMPAGSYWTQPAGEAHITSAKGKVNMAFIEIDTGPYLVRSRSKAFDNRERPFNIHISNVIWHNAGKTKLAYLWKNRNDKVTGTMVKFNGHIELEVEAANIVVIQGQVKTDNKTLNPGSLIKVSQQSLIKVSCQSQLDCSLYINSDQKFRIL